MTVYIGIFALRLVAFAHASQASESPEWVHASGAGGVFKANGKSASWTGFDKAHTTRNEDSIAIQVAGKSLKGAGDKVHIELDWKSNGAPMDSKYWNTSEYQYECAKHDVTVADASHRPQCMTGTGDFRVFVADSEGKSLKSGFTPEDFEKFKGYNFRLFPHASSKARYYKPAKGSSVKEGSAVLQSSINIANSKSKDKGPFSDSRLYPATADKPSAQGGFDVPLGEASYLLIDLERKSSNEVYMYFEMKDSEHRIRYTHRLASGDEQYLPETVDTVIISYPNERGYTSLDVTLHDWSLAPSTIVV